MSGDEVKPSDSGDYRFNEDTYHIVSERDIAQADEEVKWDKSMVKASIE
jgi:hypothetical protein